MSLSKMRPEQIHDRILLQREKSGVEFFLQYNHLFVEVDCPACGHSDHKIEFYKYGFAHKQCSSCSTLYVSSRPTEDLLFKYYGEFEAPKMWNEILIATNNERKYLQHLPRVERLREIVEIYKNAKQICVDLGAGNGNFAKAVMESGIFSKVIASEIVDNCIEACQKQGLETHKGTVDDLEDSSIDCITFNDLIEHVFNPFEFIATCYQKLRKGGILMLSTPNGAGFDFQILGDKTVNITPPEHIQYLNPTSISLLLKRVGFDVIEAKTPGILDVEIVKRQRNNKNFDIKSTNCFIEYLYSLNNEQVEEKFQSFLQEANLSSHMLVFARKTQ